jgi:hypothetical protein
MSDRFSEADLDGESAEAGEALADHLFTAVEEGVEPSASIWLSRVAYQLMMW